MDINTYKNKLHTYIDNIDHEQVNNVVKVLRRAIEDRKMIYVAGNGGSMATAIHFAEDMMLGNNHSVKTLTLSNISTLTAISNDIEYNEVFLEQLRKLMEEGDILFCISASGNSRNLINAIQFANKKGETIGLSGFNGGEIKRASTHHIYTKTKVGEYELTEDLHYIICHMIACLIRGE